MPMHHLYFDLLCICLLVIQEKKGSDPTLILGSLALYLMNLREETLNPVLLLL